MRKLISTIIVSTLLIGGCSTVHKAKHSSQSIPEEVPASQYKGQGFQPVAEKVLSHMRKNIVKNTKNLANNF